jgi:hypothetical protein
VNVLLHALDGRLRIRLGSIKRNLQAAASVTQSLLSLDGVKAVRANPVTGSVLVHYDPWRISQTDLLELLGVSQPFSSSASGPGNVNGSEIGVTAGVSRSVADVVVRVMLEAVCYYAARRLFAVRL